MALTVLGSGGSAMAFEIDTGNEDIEMRWDNTVRYNTGMRVQGRNDKIANSPNSDEGTYSFDRGDVVTNRVDLLSEFDFSYKKQLGFRVSGAAWYDAAYGDDSNSNPRYAGLASYENRKYSNYTDRFYAGPSGEILDAFVFANFDLGEVPTKVRAGRHTVFWGESLFLGGALHGVSYSQMPLDLQKGFATPGVEAKELFRPLNQISGQLQLTDTLSVAGQYFLEWESYRYPEGGTYLGPVDFAFNGPDRVAAAQLPVNPLLGPLSGQYLGYTNAGEIKPHQSGEFGLNARWSPAAIDGTIGFYYRRYADKLPQALVTKSTNLPIFPVGHPLRPASGQPLMNGSEYSLIYPDKIDLYGISFAKNIGGISFGSELSYRHNTPLLSKILGAPSPIEAPERGETGGPRGNTMHGLVNAVGLLPETPLFGSASWAVELVWSRWTKVTSGKALFNAEDYGGCTFFATNMRGDKNDGCATKNYFGIGLAFTPTWYQVMPGVDLSMPITYSRGLKGNAATVFGGNEDNGSFSIGLGADVFQKHRIDLKYVGYFGQINDYGVNGAGQQLITQNGFTTLLKDRDFISLTLKTTF
ncbi:MAG TPA: DUF1302 domain-containing protein [Azonexus sp.]